MKAVFAAIIILSVLGCASTPRVPLTFKEPVEAGSYKMHFSDNMSEASVTRILAHIRNAQEKVPKLVFSADFYVIHKYVGFRNQGFVMAGVERSDDSLVLFITPYFQRQNRNYQEAVIIHEMVHAKLFTLGLLDEEQCQIDVHEHIAYSVSLPFNKDFDDRAAIKNQILSYADKVAKCDMHKYGKFYQEFAEYM